MAPAGTVKLEGARYLITVDPERRIIRDGTIVVDGQRISHVGKAADLADVPADRTIDAHGMVITPGFCNTHLHVSYAHATRGIFPDDLGPGYLPNVFKLQGAMTPRDEYYTSLLGITELLKYGTTCFLDPGSTKHIQDCLPAYEESGCRIITGTHVTDRPNPLNLPELSTSDAVRAMESTVQEFDGQLEGRVRAWTMPFSPAFSTTPLLQEAKRLADAYGVGLTLHFNNSNGYVNACLEDFGLRPTQFLESIGVLGENVLLSHALGLNESEVDVIARTGARVAAAPTAALKGAYGMTRNGLLPEMLDRGITAGIATDAGNNSNLVETHRAMYLIAVLYKDARQSTGVISAETALELATIRGAAALGLDQDIGSIEAGKKADLVLFDTNRVEWSTMFNPVTNLVYNADGRSVHTVMVDGRIVVENHTPLFVDEEKLIAEVQALGEDMLRRTGISFPSRWPVV